MDVNRPANARKISLRSDQCERVAMNRVLRLSAVYSRLQQARSNHLPIAEAVQSAPSEARAHQDRDHRANQDVTFLDGPGFEKPQVSHGNALAICLDSQAP